MIFVKGVLIGFWFAALALGERLAPAAARPPGSDRVRLFRNLGLWAANTLSSPLVFVPIGAAAAGLQLWTRPELPLWAGLAIDLLLLDLWTYAWHRANHQWPPLWRFHRVHHLDEFLDVTSAVRFHPGEVLISALARAPLIVAADISIVSILVLETVLLLSALFHHSNLRLPARLEAALRLVIATPSHHWVHHHARRADTDSNYASVLTIWDRLFDSWSATERTQEMCIGVEGERDRPLTTLAAAPFR
jgi:sterol desaturase/sphingolipid hydroxylase (fatty acid hydroxylase superfamily)